jgi:hypothetical protein
MNPVYPNLAFCTERKQLYFTFWDEILEEEYGKPIHSFDYQKFHRPGLIETHTLNPDMLYDVPNSGTLDRDNPLWIFGVCDNPQQAFDYCLKELKDDDRNICIFATHIPKIVEEQGGWRWHKWGEYIGEGEPTTEYLSDEELFGDGVYVFSAYEVP